VAVDATGLETRHVSVHYARRSRRHRGHYKRGFPKLSALCEIRSHVIVAAVVDRGPCPDMVEWPELMRRALARLHFDTWLGDAGYESEGAHQRSREELGIRSIVPTTERGRPRHDGQPRPVRGAYRRQLQRRFPRKTYGQRWQIEAAFSMLKRKLDSALRRRRPFALNREVLLRVITFNLMLIRRHAQSFQQSMTDTIYILTQRNSVCHYLPGLPGLVFWGGAGQSGKRIYSPQ
jgi:hypothetical protein